jgi:hypothetical protein
MLKWPDVMQAFLLSTQSSALIADPLTLNAENESP